MRKLRRGFEIWREAGLTEFLQRTYWWVLRELWLRTGPKTGHPAIRNKIADLRTLCSSDTPVIVDGGSHRGQTIDELLGEFETYRIHSFEANPDRASQLKSKYKNDDRIDVYNIALGPEKTDVELQLTEQDASSSVLEPTSKNIELFGDRVSVENTTSVQQNRLDNILNEVHILKLDIQGYELEALRGCDGLFDDIELILLEASFQELYEGQQDFCDISNFLSEEGFRIYNIYEGKITDSGELAEFDVIFKK